MRRALLLLAIAAALAVSPAPAIQLPSLELALSHRDPVVLANTALPRLGTLGPSGRAWLAARIAGWDIGARVAAYAFLQVGTTYRLGPLGEEKPPDTDPVIQFESTDCAVLNLVSAALAHVREAGGEREAMAIANYRRGRIAYDARFHFTTDRLDSCAYYRDITEQAGGNACRKRMVTLNRRANGSRWIPIPWSREREVVYVPRALGAQFAAWFDRGRIPAATGVAFVQESKLGDGLDVVHESLLWKGRTFLHASSRTGSVVTLPWTVYLAGPGKRYDGFVLFEYR